MRRGRGKNSGAKKRVVLLSSRFPPHCFDLCTPPLWTIAARMDPGWVFLFLFFVAEVLLVTLLCLPMPSNDVRGTIVQWVGKCCYCMLSFFPLVTHMQLHCLVTTSHSQLVGSKRSSYYFHHYATGRCRLFLVREWRPIHQWPDDLWGEASIVLQRTQCLHVWHVRLFVLYLAPPRRRAKETIRLSARSKAEYRIHQKRRLEVATRRFPSLADHTFLWRILQ